MADAAALERKLRFRLRDLDSMPFIFRKLLGVLGKPYPSPRELGLIIATDQSLSLKALRMVNSAGQGLRNRIVSVPQAVSLLGINTVRSVMLCLASYDSFFDGATPERKALWKHSLGTAILARNLAHKVKGLDAEEMFMAGMLHDVGLTVLSKHCPKEFAALRPEYLKHSDPLEAELQVLGTTHAVIGRWACEGWRLPEILNQCVEFHHNPSGVKGNLQQENAVRLIHLADYLSLQTLQPDSNELALFRPEVLAELNLTEEQVEQVQVGSLKELEDLEAYVGGGPAKSQATPESARAS